MPPSKLFTDQAMTVRDVGLLIAFFCGILIPGTMMYDKIIENQTATAEQIVQTRLDIASVHEEVKGHTALLTAEERRHDILLGNRWNYPMECQWTDEFTSLNQGKGLRFPDARKIHDENLPAQ